MNITNIVEGRRKLTDSEVRGIIRKNGIHFTHIDCNLSQNLPSLVDYVLGLSAERKQTYKLSKFYPQNLPTRDGSGILDYNVGYICDEDGISIVAFDPSSDAMDPGESYIKQIPVQEFLVWAMKDRVYMIDVYQHIQAALRKKKYTSEDHRRHFEQYL